MGFMNAGDEYSGEYSGDIAAMRDVLILRHCCAPDGVLAIFR